MSKNISLEENLRKYPEDVPDLLKWARADFTALTGNLEGRLLTLIDATFSDKQQRKAMKDIFSKELWSWNASIIKEIDDAYHGLHSSRD